MSNAPEFGQGEGTLSRAAGLVTDAERTSTRSPTSSSGQIRGSRASGAARALPAFFVLHPAWTEKQKVIVNALNEFAASLTATEKDNVSTDDAQNASYTKLQRPARLTRTTGQGDTP